MEEKEILTEKEEMIMSKMAKKLEVKSAKFKTYHCTVVDQIKEQNKLAKTSSTRLP